MKERNFLIDVKIKMNVPDGSMEEIRIWLKKKYH